jgi:hypothetical protein
MDYGARPSLQSNRLDMPGDSEAIIADSVLRAADTFTKVMAQQKEKKDRLSYSKAKSDLAAADTRIRRELEEDGDYENYLENYRIRMGEALDTIAPTISDPSDRTIFDADANLSVERGVSAMAEQRTMRRRDAAAAEVIDLGDDTKRDILATTDNASRVEKMLAFQEYVNARVDAGLLDASWAESQVKAFVSDTAMAQLKTLPLRAQAALLEASIKANQDPESEDFEPTGSLADFMHQDERVEMLRQVEKQLEGEEDLGMAQAAHDRAVNLYRANTADNYTARRSAIIDDKSLSPEQRRLAIQMLDTTEMAETRNKARDQDEIVKTYQDRIRQGYQGSTTVDLESGAAMEDPTTRRPFTVNEIPRDEWDKLTSGQQAALTQYSDAMAQGRSFNTFTHMIRRTDKEGNEMPSYSLWRRLSDQQKAQVDLDKPEWLMAFTEQDWRNMKLQQEEIRAGGGLTYNDGLTNDQMLLSALIAGGWVPKTGQNVDEQERYARGRLEFDRLVQEEMRRQGAAKLSNPERKKILAEMLTSQGYLDRDFIFSDYDEDEAMPAFMMNPEQLDRAFLDIRKADAEMRTLANGDTLNMREILIAQAMNSPDDPVYPGLGLPKEPSQKDLERAYFAYKANLGVEEVNRRLRGE